MVGSGFGVCREGVVGVTGCVEVVAYICCNVEGEE